MHGDEVLVIDAAALADVVVPQATQAEREQMRQEIRQTIQDAQQAAREAQQAAQATAARDAGRMQGMDEELAKAREAVAAVAGARAEGSVSVTRDEAGRTVVRTGDGRTIVVDPRAVPSAEAQQAIIHTALAPLPPPAPFEDRGPPENVIILTGIVMFFLTLMLIGFPIARATARRMDRKAAAPQAAPEAGARLERIEQAVEAIAVEVERVSEAQRYSARLLTERLPETVPALAERAAATPRA